MTELAKALNDMPSPGEIAAKEELRRTLIKLSEARDKQAELREAAREGATAAIAALNIKPVAGPKKDARRKEAETAIAVLGDWQLAKVTPSYSTEMAEERIEVLGDKIAEIVAIQRKDHPVPNLWVPMVGDLIEGEMIFPGQAHLIDASLFRQVCIDGPRILGNFLRRMLGMFEHVTVDGVIGNHGCGSDDMKCVTMTGNKYWHEINEGDLVLSALDDGTRCWEPVRRVIAYHYTGKLHRLHSRDVSGAVTADHRIVGCTPDNPAWREWRASEQRPKTTKLMISAHNPHPDAPIPDDDIARAAWCLTDSHRDKRGYWHFYQSGEKSERMLHLFGHLSRGVQRRERRPQHVAGKPVRSWLSQVEMHVHADDSRALSDWVPDRERLPGWVWSLSERQVGVLLDEWVFTDGNTWKRGDARCINISRQGLREDLQRLLVMNGWAATASEYRPGHWRLNITRRSWSHYSSPDEQVDYDGIVWCVQVDTGRFFVEHEGKVHLTGNSVGGRARRDYHPETNADAMMYEVTRQVLEASGQDRLDFSANYVELERMWYKVREINGKSWLLFHGDQARGGNGISGLPYPTLTSKVLKWGNGGIAEHFDYVLCGHYHTPTRMTIGAKTLWMSGSTESSNTYASEFFAAMGDPTQWLLFSTPSGKVGGEYLLRLAS